MAQSIMPGDAFIANYIYPLFSSSSDAEMLTQMVWISFFYTLSVIVSMAIFPAPYGRYSSSKYGFLIPGKFAWITQESPAFIVPILLLLTTSSPCWSSLTNKILLVAVIIHYIQRSLIFPLTIRGGKATPITPYISALIFCLFNGLMQGRYLLNYHCYEDTWIYTPQFILGMSLFCIGMAINIHSDQLLVHLRKPGETGYKIPVGGLFDYVTGANFFGEIVEWTGFALASCSLPAGIFAFFSASFLSMRAWHHHKYYLSKFEDYPSKRKIVIPYLI